MATPTISDDTDQPFRLLKSYRAGKIDGGRVVSGQQRIWEQDKVLYPNSQPIQMIMDFEKAAINNSIGLDAIIPQCGRLLVP